jgi:hypothetical protein
MNAARTLTILGEMCAAVFALPAARRSGGEVFDDEESGLEKLVLLLMGDVLSTY